MLGRKNYAQEEIDAARAMVEADLRAYKRLPEAAKTKEFEAVFFNRAVLLLDYMFVYRLAGIEGKDGNPLKEVRVDLGQAANRQTPRMADVRQCCAQAPTGYVRAEAQGRRRGEAKRN
jgi:hypothetical protein